MKEFPSLLQTYLIDYLPRRRGFSPHTISAYRDTFVLLLRWVSSCEGIPPDQVTMEDLGPDRVNRFSDWLRHERECVISTVNARTAAIRSFAKFVQTEAPEHIEICRQLLQIRTIRSVSHAEVEHLSVEAVQRIIIASSHTLRDLAIVSLLYDSGARVSEVCTMTIGDLTLTRPHTARAIGKGRKARVIPLSAEAGQILSRYLASIRANASPTASVFVNRSGNPLGRAGIAYVLQKAVTMAHASHPEEVPPKAHPRVLRHSKAMHLLDAGVNLVYIRDFLGHESVTTTEIYARASTEAKRRAIEMAESNIVPESFYDDRQRTDLIDWLRGLL